MPSVEQSSPNSTCTSKSVFCMAMESSVSLTVFFALKQGMTTLTSGFFTGTAASYLLGVESTTSQTRSTSSVVRKEDMGSVSTRSAAQAATGVSATLKPGLPR